MRERLTKANTNENEKAFEKFARIKKPRKIPRL